MKTRKETHRAVLIQLWLKRSNLTADTPSSRRSVDEGGNAHMHINYMLPVPERFLIVLIHIYCEWSICVMYYFIRVYVYNWTINMKLKSQYRQPYNRIYTAERNTTNNYKNIIVAIHKKCVCALCISCKVARASVWLGKYDITYYFGIPALEYIGMCTFMVESSSICKY